MSNRKKECIIIMALTAIICIALGAYVIFRDFSDMSEPWGTIDTVIIGVLIVGGLISIGFTGDGDGNSMF